MHSITPETTSAQTVKEQFEKCLKQNFYQRGFFLPCLLRIPRIYKSCIDFDKCD